MVVEPWVIKVTKDFMYEVPEKLREKINLRIGDTLTFEEDGEKRVKCITSGGYSFIVKFS